MKRLDTNILLYATDEDCREHDAAIRLVNDALRSPADWMLADQVLFEMYAPFLPVPLFDPGAKMSGKKSVDRALASGIGGRYIATVLQVAACRLRLGHPFLPKDRS